MVDDSGWIQCLNEAFNSAFDPLTEVFPAMLVFLRTFRSSKTVGAEKQNLIMDYYRRNFDGNHKIDAKRSDQDILNFILREIQTSLLEMNSRASLEAYGLLTPTEGLETSPDFPEAPSRNNESLKEIGHNSLKEFNQGQRIVFDTLLNEILPGVTAKDTFFSVHRPFNHECSRSRA